MGHTFQPASATLLSTGAILNLTKSEIVERRVADIILDINHPQAKRYGGYDAIGTIFFGSVEGDETLNKPELLPVAKPLFSFLKYYPLLNEIVLIVKSLSKNIYTIEGAINNYYFPTINTWTHPHHNAMPILSQYQEDKNTSEDYKKTKAGIKRQVSDNKTDIPLGEYFQEKLNIKPLLPYEGDSILEGRFGNSIRLGSTAKDAPKKSPWSDIGENSDPIIVIRNGQDPETSNEGWVPILENINKDASSIYLMDGQKIRNFKVATAKSSVVQDSYEAEFSEKIPEEEALTSLPEDPPPTIPEPQNNDLPPIIPEDEEPDLIVEDPEPDVLDEISKKMQEGQPEEDVMTEELFTGPEEDGGEDEIIEPQVKEVVKPSILPLQILKPELIKNKDGQGVIPKDNGGKILTLALVDGMAVEKTTAENFKKMQKAAFDTGTKPTLKINSGFRSPQDALYYNGERISSSQKDLRIRYLKDEYKVSGESIFLKEWERDTIIKPEMWTKYVLKDNKTKATIKGETYITTDPKKPAKVKLSPQKSYFRVAVATVNSELYKWLIGNSWKYGFVRTVKSEEWHFIYNPSLAADGPFSKLKYFKDNPEKNSWYITTEEFENIMKEYEDSKKPAELPTGPVEPEIAESSKTTKEVVATHDEGFEIIEITKTKENTPTFIEYEIKDIPNPNELQKYVLNELGGYSILGTNQTREDAISIFFEDIDIEIEDFKDL